MPGQQKLADVEWMGTEFALGELVRDARIPRLGVGALLAAGFVGGPALGPLLALPQSDPTPTDLAVVGGWVLTRLMASAGVLAVAWRRYRPGRLLWFTGGLVQIAGDNGEPRVIRWAEAETVVMGFGWDSDLDDPVTGPDTFALLGSAGVRIDIAKEYGRRLPRDLATAAVRILAARLVPPLIHAFESGPGAEVGYTLVSRNGVANTMPWDPKFTAWTQVRCIVPRASNGLVGRVVLFDDDHRSLCEIDLSAVPNGCFMPHLIRHAATQNRVMLLGDAWPETSTATGPTGGNGADSH